MKQQKITNMYVPRIGAPFKEEDAQDIGEFIYVRNNLCRNNLCLLLLGMSMFYVFLLEMNAFHVYFVRNEHFNAYFCILSSFDHGLKVEGKR
jgi:hypothetical protein